MILVFLVSFNITTIDLFWHGMQRPNWLNYRYSFIFCFFIILLAYKAFERLSEIGYRKLLPVCASLVLILLILQKQEYENVDDFSTVWLSLGIIAIYLGTLRAVTYSKKSVRQTGVLVLCVLVCTEMFGAGLLNMYGLGMDVVYSTRTSYRTFIDGLKPSVDAVLEADPSFYRMEKTVHRKTNDNFTLNMNGLSNSTSTLNTETIQLLNSYGLSSKSHWSKYLGGTPVSDTIFGIKYVVAESNGEEILELYEETEYGDSDYTVWKNPYAMSLAAGVSPDLAGVSTEDYLSAFELMNATVTAMLGSDEPVEVFRKAEMLGEPSTESCMRTTVAKHIKYAPVDGALEARINFSVQIDTDDVLYLFIPTEYPRECLLYVNGRKCGSYYGNETDRIVELGSFEPGEIVTVTLETTEEAVYVAQDEHYFYYLDSEVFEENAPALNECAFMIHEYNDDRFEGTINIKEGRELVYTSIPYDEGWRVYANGKSVDIEKLIDGTIGFRLDEGEYELQLKYRPSCLYLGIFTSVLGGFSFAALWFLTELLRKIRLDEGRAVYVIPDRGDVRFDDLPVLPDESAFECGEPLQDKVSKTSADVEIESPEIPLEGTSANAENSGDMEENI